MHLAVSSAADVIGVACPKAGQRVVRALGRPLIPYLSRMTPKIEG
jgi:hypothetical protein